MVQSWTSCLSEPEPHIMFSIPIHFPAAFIFLDAFFSHFKFVMPELQCSVYSACQCLRETQLAGASVFLGG